MEPLPKFDGRSFDEIERARGHEDGADDIEREDAQTAQRKDIPAWPIEKELLPDIKAVGDGSQPDESRVVRPFVRQSLFDDQHGGECDSDEEKGRQRGLAASMEFTEKDQERAEERRLLGKVAVDKPSHVRVSEQNREGTSKEKAIHSEVCAHHSEVEGDGYGVKTIVQAPQSATDCAECRKGER